MTVEEQIREFIDGNVEHIDLAGVQRGPVIGLDAATRPRPVILAMVGVGAIVLVVAGLLAIGQSTTDDRNVSTTPQNTPTSSTATATSVTASTTVVNPPPNPAESGPTTAGSTIAQVSHLDGAALFDLYKRLSNARTISFDAIDREVQQCMNQKGINDVPTPTFLLADSNQSGDDLSWRFPTDQQAATTGYLRSSSTLITVGEPPAGTPEFAALYGNIIGTWEYPDAPAGFGVAGDIYDGCLPTAQTRIIGNGDPKAAFRINDYDYRLQRVLYPAIRVVTTSPEFVAAQDAWVLCMANAGFDVNDLADPLTRLWAEPRPSPAETAMAATDAVCKSSTGVRDLGDRLFNEQVTKWFDAHPDDREEIIDFANGVVERSADGPPATTP